MQASGNNTMSVHVKTELEDALFVCKAASGQSACLASSSTLLMLVPSFYLLQVYGRLVAAVASRP